MHGNTNTDGLVERFKERCDIDNNGCWIWKSIQNKSGTPLFSTSFHGVHFYISARRFCWEQILGNRLHRNLEIHVSCENNLCVNPNHLYERTDISRLEEHIIKNTDNSCWIWNGHIPERYGTLRFGGKNNVKVHRIVWELYKGEIPNNLQVLHMCDNPLCVNPDHLFLGTIKDNMLDMVRKDRCKLAKLKADDVREIRMSLSEGNPIREIAKKFNVSKSTIMDIKNERTWIGI